MDARDAAQAIRKALEAPMTGAEVFIIASADPVMRRPNAKLLAEVFPAVALKDGVGPSETLVSIAKAQRMLEYQPQHSWRDQREEALPWNTFALDAQAYWCRACASAR